MCGMSELSFNEVQPSSSPFWSTVCRTPHEGSKLKSERRDHPPTPRLVGYCMDIVCGCLCPCGNSNFKLIFLKICVYIDMLFLSIYFFMFSFGVR